MCTSFHMPFHKYKLSGRTMDFEKKPDRAYIYFMPRGENYVSHDMRKFLSELGINLYQSDNGNPYSFVGAANEFGFESLHTETRIFADGLNEHGISVSMQWLPNSEFPYTQSQATEDNPLFLSWYLPSYILGNVQSLDNLIALFDSSNSDPILKVFEINRIAGRDINLPFHFNVQDAQRNSLVIEFEKGVVKLYDSRDPQNTFLKDSGALTNYPFYHEQVALYQTFLNNNPGISPVNKPKSGDEPQEVNGSGLLGMPGDGTPISRFTRTHLLMESVYDQPINEMDAVGSTIQMLGSISVPIGTIATNEDKNTPGDSTLWSTVRDHEQLKYYFYDQHNNQLRMVNLNKLKDTTDKKSILLNDINDQWFIDKTNQLT